MRRPRTAALVAFVMVLLAGATYVVLHRETEPPSIAAAVAITPGEADSPARDQTLQQNPTIGEEILTEYASPDRPPVYDMELLDRLMLSYRSLVKNYSDRPTGTNADFVEAWCGDNPAKLKLLPKSFPHFSEGGELLDRWGSPVFFHPEAADRVTLRSAGPDRQMWNGDDVVFPAD